MVEGVLLDSEAKVGARDTARDAADALEHSLFEANPQPMWLLDGDTRAMVQTNQAALDQYGWTRDEFLALPPMALDDPTEVGRPSALSDGTIEVRSVRHRRKDGSTFSVELVSRVVVHRGRTLRLVIAHDVSRRLHTENELHESERRFRDVLENVQLASVVLDVRGHVTFVNEFAANLLGWTTRELTGRDWFATCLPPGEAGEARERYEQRIPRGAIKRNDEHEVRTRAGGRRRIAWSNIVLRDAHGEVAGTASVGADVTDQRELERRLWHDARHDPVTGLPNRTLFLERLAQVVERGRRDEDFVYAMLFVDLDRFKVVNDSLGHGIGDQLLRAAGHALCQCVREHDLVARLGGDEYAVLLDGIIGQEQAAEVAMAIQARFVTPFALDGHEVYSTASIGVAMKMAAHEAPEDVVRDADTALHRAKALGKARHEFFRPAMRAGARARMRLENDLRRALARQEFRLAYQPIVTLADGALVGFEALIRWQHEERGVVPPAEFITLAEETGLIVPMGEWVLREACAQMAAWGAENEAARRLVVNVNVSGRQLGPELVGQVDRAILDHGIAPENLKLEITESVIMDSPATAAELLRRIKARGVRICIDDFGTGYSSLATLVRLPIDTMKIDRMFVAGMGSDRDTAEVVHSIVALAASLKLDVVAEGVETEEQRRALIKLGCAYAQGYLFARPLEAPAVLGLLQRALASGSDISEG